MHHLSVLLLSLAIQTCAFPVHFPPVSFTNSTAIGTSQLSLLIDPDAAISWDEASSPSILLCDGANFTGECRLVEKNAPETCLNVNHGVGETSVGMQVGSLKMGGHAGCALYAGPACTGAIIVFRYEATITDLAARYTHKIMSLFCEPLRKFDPVDPPPPKQGLIRSRNVAAALDRIAGLMPRRHRRSYDAPTPRLKPQTEADAGVDDGSPSRNTWKPSWPRPLPTQSQPCGGGVPYMASTQAQGCMDPGSVGPARII